jgi:hypothetical protein
MLFWDVDLGRLDPEQHRDFILGRLLSEGDWAVVQATRAWVGDDAIADYVRRDAGRRLDRRTRRFLEVVLDIPPEPCTKTSSTSPSAPLFRP